MLLTFTDRNKLYEIIKLRKEGSHELRCDIKYNSVCELLPYLSTDIINNIIKPYVNDVIILNVVVTTDHGGYNYADTEYDKYSYRMFIKSQNVNIQYNMYDFEYLCRFTYELGNNNHRGYTVCRNYYKYIDPHILKYDRHILHNFDKDPSQQSKYYITNSTDFKPTYANHSLDNLKILFDNYKDSYTKSEYTYFNEHNVTTYNIVNRTLFLGFRKLVLIMNNEINSILKKLIS